MIEAQPFRRIVGPMHAISVQQSRARLGQIAMPHLIGLFPQRNAMQLAPTRFVEQTQFHLLRVLGEQREVHSFSIPGCAKRVGFSWPDDQWALWRQCVYLKGD